MRYNKRTLSTKTNIYLPYQTKNILGLALRTTSSETREKSAKNNCSEKKNMKTALKIQ